MRNYKIVIAVGLLAIGSSSIFAGDIQYASYAFGKIYTSTISAEALNDAPKWTTTHNPPLSARQAMKIADVRREELVQDDDRFRWRRTSATIVFSPVDDTKCYWQIQYTIEPKGKLLLTGRPITLDLFVLMDGTLVEPKITETKKAVKPDVVPSD